MNTSLGARRKKKTKGKILSSRISENSSNQTKFQIKTRVTSKYQKAEKEVQILLDRAHLLSDQKKPNESKETNENSESIEFFFSENQTLAKSVQLKHFDNDDDDGSQKSASSQSASEKLELESDLSSNHGGNQTASTFIHIESDHDECIEYRLGTKHSFDLESLYTPSTVLKHPIAQLVTTTLNANSKRILNRYHEQAKEVGEKIPPALLNALQTPQNNKNGISYKTLCLHEFHPIFCEASSNIVDVPLRQLVKIFIKEIRFTRHPLLTDEHTIANELDDLFEEYIRRKAENVEENLTKPLNIERKVASVLMGRAVDGRLEEHFMQKLQEHLFKIKELRTRLYAEEAYTKNLIKQILDKWIQLKKLRQSQNFQCTRFKLSIKIPELSEKAVAKSRKKWEERFQNDLKEIYREELETYYSAKRVFKTKQDGVVSKPKKPSLTRLSSELKDRYENSFYMPEEPKLEITRSRCSDEEFYENTLKIGANGNQVRKLRSFFVRIHLDNEFVADSRSYRLEPDLSLKINEAISVIIERRRPKEIKITLFEKCKLSTLHKVADIVVPLPLSGTIKEASSHDKEFLINKVSFASKKEPINGWFYMGVKCQNDVLHRSFFTQFPAPLANNEKKSIEPPANSSDEEESQSLSDADTCTLEENLLQFCSIDDIKNNARFNALRSRFLKLDERSRDLCFVPALDHELQFQADSEEEEPVIEAGCWMDLIDLHKHYGKNYVRNLYAAIKSQCSRLDRAAESSEHLLIGDEPGNWSLLFDAFSTIFHPGRPLNPNRGAIVKASHASAHEWSGTQNFSIILNAVRATGIPVRYNKSFPTADFSKNTASNTFISSNLKYSNVRPFIALSYKDKFCRTTTAEGSHPTWNEQLVLQFSGPLSDLRDDLKISLFDEVIENQVNDEVGNMQRSVDIYHRIQSNWLGEYRIPMGNLLQRQKIDGNVELMIPKILLYYKRPTLDSIAPNLDTQILVEIKESVQLYFYLSLEPGLDVPRINTKSLECSELIEVRQKLHEWSILVRELQPRRFIEPLVCTEEGKRVCLTRLIEPIPLIPIENEAVTLESICRYVALLCTMKQFEPCMGFGGVWLNNQTILDTTWGSVKDLGVLLCNFLLGLGFKCWLALGISNTWGEVAFVIVRLEDGQQYFIEPQTGKSYALKDVLCPLNAIHYVVAQDNIFCNIQAEARVSMMSFNFNDTSCWLAAFNKRSPAPLGGVQKLNYEFHESLSVAQLSKNIERKVMKKITSWRTMQKTIWNRAFQPRLQKILFELEAVALNNAGNGHEEARLLDQIHVEFPGYKIYGFVLNFAYTNLSAISERIRSTSIHLNSDPNVEYSLAVHIHVWPNNVLSVWIFLISVSTLTIT